MLSGMCVVFYSSFVCISACANVYFKSILRRVAFPTRKRLLWYSTKSRFFLLVVFENFQNLSLKCLWDGSGVGCNVAQPNSPQNVLADRPRVRQYTLAQPTSRRGGLGCATLQPTPEPSHKHFSERFRKFSKTTSKKNCDFVVYHKGLFLVGNATRNQPTRHRNC